MTDSHVRNRNRGLPKGKNLCQSMDGVGSCFKLTESNAVQIDGHFTDLF